MKFEEIDWRDRTEFKNNLGLLARNIYKIKYFYEEDQLMKIGRAVSNPEARSFLMDGYNEAVKEADTYLETIGAFLDGTFSIPENNEYFDALLLYMDTREQTLFRSELENPEGFIPWFEEDKFILMAEIEANKVD